VLPSSNRQNETSGRSEAQRKSSVENLEPVPEPDDVIELDEDELKQIENHPKPVSKAASLAGSASKKSLSVKNPELNLSRKGSIDNNFASGSKDPDNNSSDEKNKDDTGKQIQTPVPAQDHQPENASNVS